MSTIVVKIAPDMKDIHIRGNVMSTKFNGMQIKFIMRDQLAKECHEYLKRQFQHAIMVSSKTWYLRKIMEDIRTTDGLQLGLLQVNELPKQ